MLTSINPKGQIEAYTDIGQFIGILPPDYPGLKISKGVNDGGPGSGNFGHKGRPGKIGGSGEGDGGSSGDPTETKEETKEESAKTKVASPPKKKPAEIKKKAVGIHSEMRKTEAGKKNADSFRERYKEDGLRGNADSFKSDFGENLRHEPTIDWKFDKFMDRCYSVMEESGDMTPKHGKERNWSLKSNAGFWGHPEKQKKLLTDAGYTDAEAEAVYNDLIKYTTGDWREVDSSVLDEYIKKRKDCYAGALFRGVLMNKREYGALLKECEAGVISFDRVVSWSASEETATDFADPDQKEDFRKANDTCGVVFNIVRGCNRSATPIVEFSKFWKEQEALSPSDATYSVVAVTEAVKNSKNVNQKRVTYITLIERGAEYDE